MEPLAITLSEADLPRLREAASRRGVSLEEAAAAVMRLGLERERVIAQGLAALERLRAEAEPIEEDEAMRIAIEEVRAMGAERRAGRRPQR